VELVISAEGDVKMASSLGEQVLDYISTQYKVSKDSIDVSKSLVDQGVIDSLSFVEIALFLEKTCSVKIGTELILPENFDSINRIVEFVESLPGVG
jgi:acyl carrier protein